MVTRTVRLIVERKLNPKTRMIFEGTAFEDLVTD